MFINSAGKSQAVIPIELFAAKLPNAKLDGQIKYNPDKNGTVPAHLSRMAIIQTFYCKTPAQVLEAMQKAEQNGKDFELVCEITGISL